MEDETGSVSTLRLFLRASTSPSAAMNAALGLVSVLAGVSTAAVRRIGITYGEELPESRNPAGDNRYAGQFIWRAGAGDDYFLVSIPALRPDLLVAEGDDAGFLVDETHPDVQAFTSAVVNGIFVNPFGDAVTLLSEAFLQVRS